MKILNIEAIKKNISISPNLDLSMLPKELLIAYSIQYKNLAFKLKKIIEQKGYNIKGFQQVLGCTKLKSNYAILLIGSGKFHALNLAMQNKQVYIYDNNYNKILKISEKELEALKRNKQASINRFFHSSRIGILVSTKYGQENLNEAKKISEKIEKKYPEKKVYLFISNNINLNELENFQIESWINTACQGLVNDSKKILNYDDIIEFL